MNGGAGTDSLVIVNTAANGGVTPAILTGFENIQMTSTANSSISLVVATDVAKVISKSSTADDTFSNLQSAASVEIDGSSGAVAVTYKNSLLSGTADSLSLTVKGGTDATTVSLQGATASNVVETLNLVSSGSTANAVDAITSNSVAIATINLTGSADLTLGTGTAFASGDVLIGKLDATSYTGNLTAYIDENSGGAYSITGGSGNDNIYLDGVDAFYNADNGNGASNKVTSIVGGAGNDTLQIDGSLIASQLVTSTASTADNVLSGVENIKLTASAPASSSNTTTTLTVDASVSADVTSVEFVLSNVQAESTDDTYNEVLTGEITNIKAQAITATGTLTSVDAADTLNLGLKTYDGSATTTSLSATLAGTFSTVTVRDATDDSTTTAVTETGAVESVSIATGASNLTVASLVAASAFGLTLSGAKNVTVTAADLGTTDTSSAATTDDLVTITASALTGNLDLTKSEAGIYSITTGTGTNAIRLGDYADDTTVIGGGTETVYVSDTGTSSVTVDVTATGVETLVIDTITGGDDVFNMAAVAAGTTVKVVDAAAAAGFGVSISNINGQNIDVVTANDSSTDTNFASGAVIALAKATAASGVSVKLSGTTVGATATDSNYDGTIKTSGVLTVDSQIQTSAGAYLATALELEGTSASALLTSLVLNGGGAYSTSANATVTISNSSTDHVALTNINASGFTGNIDVTDSSIFNYSTSAAAITLGGAGTLTVATADMDRDELSIIGGAGATTVVMSGAIVANSLRPAMTGVETLQVQLDDDGNSSLAAASLELRDTTGLADLTIDQKTDGSSAAGTFDEKFTVANLASGATVHLTTSDAHGALIGTGSGDGLYLTSAVAQASEVSLDNAGSTYAVTLYDLNLGDTYTTVHIDQVIASVNMTVSAITGSGVTSVSIENNTTTSAGDLTVSALSTTALTTLTLDSTKGNVIVSDLGTVNSLETLTVNTGVAASGDKTTISAGTSTSIDTITASGTGAFQITALTASSLDSIAASGVTGVVTLGNTTTAALTTASGASIVTGTGNDIVSVNSSTLGTVTLGSVTNSSGVLTDNDTLYLIGAQGSGTGVIDLSQTGDQILTINGQSNTTVQSGIDSVNVASMTSANSYGWTLTARSAGSTITGSDYNDVINGAAGADTLNGGSGADTIITNGGGDTVTGGAGNDTITLGAGVDTIVFSAVADNGADTITAFTVASDLINVELLAGGNVTAEVAIAADASTATASATGKLLVFADGADGISSSAITSYTTLSDVATFLDAGITQSTTASETYAVIINDLVTSKAYVYNVTTGSTGTLGSSQVTLVGTITTSAAVTTTETIFTT